MHKIHLTGDDALYKLALEVRKGGYQEHYAILMKAEEIDNLFDNSEDRSKAQNRLMWRWNNEAAKQMGHTVNEIHGLLKMNVLNPQLKVWGGKLAEQADNFDSVKQQLNSYEHALLVSYDMIRTKDLSTKRMAWYLTNVDMYCSMNGLHLSKGDDEYLLAMGEEMAGR